MLRLQRGERAGDDGEGPFAIEHERVIRRGGQRKAGGGVGRQRDVLHATAAFFGESGVAMFGKKMLQRAEQVAAKAPALPLRSTHATREHAGEKCVRHFPRRIFVAPTCPELAERVAP